MTTLHIHQVARESKPAPEKPRQDCLLNMNCQIVKVGVNNLLKSFYPHDLLTHMYSFISRKRLRVDVVSILLHHLDLLQDAVAGEYVVQASLRPSAMVAEKLLSFLSISIRSRVAVAGSPDLFEIILIFITSGARARSFRLPHRPNAQTDLCDKIY